MLIAMALMTDWYCIGININANSKQPCWEQMSCNYCTTVEGYIRESLLQTMWWHLTIGVVQEHATAHSHTSGQWCWKSLSPQLQYAFVVPYYPAHTDMMGGNRVYQNCDWPLLVNKLVCQYTVQVRYPCMGWVVEISKHVVVCHLWMVLVCKTKGLLGRCGALVGIEEEQSDKCDNMGKWTK